jgi:sugar transferase EpsL
MPLNKRLLDVLVASAGLIILSPLILLLAIGVRLFLGSPVIFRQKRPGFQGHPFEIYKFRSMNEKRGPDGTLLPDAQRLTRFGRMLRTLSLDELPELWNILRGEMSLVGPRPLLIEYLPRYSPEQMHRHDVLPGLTGWAQIHGRNAITWQDKFALDVWYVRNRSLWLDIKILWITFKRVIARENISQPGQATTDYFLGNKD